MKRTGVFICWCGTNIAATVDIQSVMQAAKQMPGVVFATDYRYMCSEVGQQLIKDSIKKEKLDRIVVGSCSPRMHENTFRKAAEAAGLNPYMVEIANLREHCSWVHKDMEKATLKAISLVRAAVAKAMQSEELFASELEIEK
ncbi:MAG: CoB--CoM heterodisulfide reductase iron-sulfur subunit A family protein, partial [Firmicutes bacterium]|nr:CoB--CoM heterodisulfide reductase iron-sulfur subunit A family protein [Bacillota bacterium]